MRGNYHLIPELSSPRKGSNRRDCFMVLSSSQYGDEPSRRIPGADPVNAKPAL